MVLASTAVSGNELLQRLQTSGSKNRAARIHSSGICLVGVSKDNMGQKSFFLLGFFTKQAGTATWIV